jgi:hypothetical protein
MYAELIVILVIISTVAFVYLKSSVIKAFVLLINVIVSAAVAFAYFETLGRIIIGYDLVIAWVLPASLIVIFALTLAILNAIGAKLAPADIYLSEFADKIIRSLIAAFVGLAIAGVILTAVALMPISTQLPYERFSPTVTSFTEPDKQLILNADGFITAVSSWLSRGSLSGQKSFAVFHPDFLNEIYLDRIGTDSQNSPVAGSSAVSVSAAWDSETDLVSSSDNQPLNERGRPIIVKAVTEGSFTMSQVRLISKAAGFDNDYTGTAEVAWPIGYITSGNAVDKKNLSEKVTMRQLDFVFYITPGTVPVMLQYKLNADPAAFKLTSNPQAPPPAPPPAPTPQ